MSTPLQPATGVRRSRRGARGASGPALVARPVVVTTSGQPARPVRWWQRLRSAVLLAMLAALLGAIVAAIVGTTAIVVVLAIKHALG